MSNNDDQGDHHVRLGPNNILNKPKKLCGCQDDYFAIKLYEKKRKKKVKYSIYDGKTFY